VGDVERILNWAQAASLRQRGKSEREEQQKIEKQQRIDKWVEEEQQKMWRSPKF
jgi:hypothetical protein